MWGGTEDREARDEGEGLMPFDVEAWLKRHIPGGRVTASGWYRAKCPLHQDHSPSFAVHVPSGNFG